MAAPAVYGNWKMNLDHVEAIHLIQQLGVLLRRAPLEHVEVGVAPPFVDLRSVGSVIEADRLGLVLCAQHVNEHESGAHTGEVSLAMLERLGVRAVIVGHSERRRLYGMDDALVARTLARVAGAGLRAVVCVGEDLAVREAGRERAYVADQLRAALAGLPEAARANVTVAYEPLWAIGTGVVAEPAQVAAQNGSIRATLAEFGLEAPVLYGGSVSAENATELAREGALDGFLVGGASLRAEAFHAVCRALDDWYASTR
ncbi:MAG: triose-phosphate isomerase [Acidimicrobiales bacterium]